MSQLPDKLSDLLRLAIRDAQAVEASAEAKLNMNVWLERRDGRCLCCLAGAVMLRTLHVTPPERPPRLPIWINGLPQADKLRALDCLQLGKGFV